MRCWSWNGGKEGTRAREAIDKPRRGSTLFLCRPAWATPARIPPTIILGQGDIECVTVLSVEAPPSGGFELAFVATIPAVAPALNQTLDHGDQVVVEFGAILLAGILAKLRPGVLGVPSGQHCFWWRRGRVELQIWLIPSLRAAIPADFVIFSLAVPLTAPRWG